MKAEAIMPPQDDDIFNLRLKGKLIKMLIHGSVKDLL